MKNKAGNSDKLGYNKTAQPGTPAHCLDTCKPAVERLGIERWICAAHVKKRARNRLDGIDGWDWGKAMIWRLLTETPFDSDLEIPRLERAVLDGDSTLRRLCAGLSEKRRTLLRHRRRRDVPSKPDPKCPTVSGTLAPAREQGEPSAQTAML